MSPQSSSSLAALLVLVLALHGACREDGGPPVVENGTGAQAGEGPVWLFVGDSLTAGFGVAPADAWVSRLGETLATRDVPVQVRNAGVSGDTSAGVLRRLDWLLSERVHTVFLAIGANDGLRGLPVDALRSNLRKIITFCRSRGARVVLAGMRMPPNYGPDYTRKFAEAFGLVAREESVPLMPFLLEGVGGVSELNQGDGIHPNAEGHRHIADGVLKYLEREGLLNE